MFHSGVNRNRGTTRGGQAEFKWDDVKQDKHRENYLGHSIMAPVGRWQKNKDLQWFSKDKSVTGADELKRRQELLLVKQQEAEALACMLRGDPVPNRVRMDLSKEELTELLKKNHDDDQNPLAADHIKGVGFGLTGRATAFVESIAGLSAHDQLEGTAAADQTDAPSHEVDLTTKKKAKKSKKSKDEKKSKKRDKKRKAETNRSPKNDVKGVDKSCTSKTLGKQEATAHLRRKASPPHSHNVRSRSHSPDSRNQNRREASEATRRNEDYRSKDRPADGGPTHATKQQDTAHEKRQDDMRRERLMHSHERSDRDGRALRLDIRDSRSDRYRGRHDSSRRRHSRSRSRSPRR